MVHYYNSIVKIARWQSKQHSKVIDGGVEFLQKNKQKNEHGQSFLNPLSIVAHDKFV